jgi:DNA-binding XRE family transcriptional regulator
MSTTKPKPSTKPKTRSWREIRRERVTPEMEKDIARHREVLEAELRLAAVRKKRKKSQATVAKKLKVSQSNISQLERGGDPKLSTVAGYIDALGGKLEMVAVFDDETVPIS